MVSTVVRIGGRSGIKLYVIIAHICDNRGPHTLSDGYKSKYSRGGYRNFLRGGGTVNKSYKKVGVDPKRGWVREGDMPPPARSAEAFDTI